MEGLVGPEKGQNVKVSEVRWGHYILLPLMQWASWMSLGMMVTRLAWMAEVVIFKEADDVCFRGFLQAGDGDGLELEVHLEVLGYFSDETLKWEFSDQKGHTLLIVLNFFKGHYSRVVSSSQLGRGHGLLVLFSFCCLFFPILLGDVVGVVVPGPSSQSLARHGLSPAGESSSCAGRDLHGSCSCSGFVLPLLSLFSSGLEAGEFFILILNSCLSPCFCFFQSFPFGQHFIVFLVDLQVRKFFCDGWLRSLMGGYSWG